MDDTETFTADLERARDLLATDDVDAFHVGVVTDGTVETAFANRPEGDEREAAVRSLTLLATHVRLVAEEAGVDYATVAGDAAALADEVEERVPAAEADAEADANADADDPT